MECDTPISRKRWLGHPSISLKMFKLRQYLVTPPIQWTKPTKPKVTLKPLPPTLALKLVSKETQSDLEDHRRVKLTGGGDAKGSTKTEVGPINHFIHWFQTISANMNVEAQKRALYVSWEAASSVFANEWYAKGSWMLSKWPQFKVIKEGLNTVLRWQRLTFLLKVMIKVLQGTQPWIGSIDLTSSNLQGASLTSDFPNLNAVRVTPETKGRMDEMMMLKDELSNMNMKEGPKQQSQITGLITAPGG